MLVIPTQPLPNQQIQIQIGAQACAMNIYQNAYGLFMDLYVNDTLIIGGVICLDRTRIVRSSYLGFTGDFIFYDTENGNADPVYTGLGSQYQLLYLDETDLEGADA